MNSRVIQTVYDIILNHQTRTLSDRLKTNLIKGLFNKIKKKNPLIETSIGRFKVLVPFSHQLPFILKISPYYSTNLARIAKYVHEKYPDLKFIDIGANIGDSVALLRTKATFPILCIEGDNYFFSILKINASKFSDIYLAKTYVGESTAVVNAVSIELGGTAHLSSIETEGEKINIKTISSVLADNPLFQYAKMLKIDTDGFDNKIIRGSIDFLNIAKPVIFFEYDPFFLAQQNDDGLSIFSTLSSTGYSKALIYDNNGELLLSASLDNRMLLEDITHYYTGRKGLQYCDICAFHKDDDELFEKIRKLEMLFFEQSRI